MWKLIGEYLKRIYCCIIFLSYRVVIIIKRNMQYNDVVWFVNYVYWLNIAVIIINFVYFGAMQFFYVLLALKNSFKIFFCYFVLLNIFIAFERNKKYNLQISPSLSFDSFYFSTGNFIFLHFPFLNKFPFIKLKYFNQIE